MRTVAALQEHEQLLLIAPFEPVPLFAVLGRQGFEHQARATESGDWEVLFTRKPADEPLAGASPSALRTPQSEMNSASLASAPTVEVDARGLEPPQPLVKILEALATLPEGMGLDARTDRRPMHLYTQLESRGFTAETSEQGDGSFLTRIRRS